MNDAGGRTAVAALWRKYRTKQPGLAIIRNGRIGCMKKIGFLSFGHWTPSPQSQARSAADVLLQSIELAVEAERLGMDGAYFRVHHFAQQLASGIRRNRKESRAVICGGVVQLVRTPACHAGGRWFESRRSAIISVQLPHPPGTTRGHFASNRPPWSARFTRYSEAGRLCRMHFRAASVRQLEANAFYP